MITKTDLPQLIILYGPPGSGKGTQANILKQKLNYEFLDFGQSFRDFVKNNINSNNSDSARAIRVNDYLVSGRAILTEDFFYILESKILYNFKNHINFIIDKPGSLIEEAKWLSDIINNNNITTKFFHLILSNGDALDRITHRWYIPNDNTPYPSYKEASKHAQGVDKPYQRVEDESAIVSAKRIENMYSQHNEIIKVYNDNQIPVISIDADRTVEEVNSDILNRLTSPNK
jgi:adenylate kinase